MTSAKGVTYWTLFLRMQIKDDIHEHNSLPISSFARVSTASLTKDVSYPRKCIRARAIDGLSPIFFDSIFISFSWDESCATMLISPE